MFHSDDKVFNDAVFAIELYGIDWNFGPLTFSKIEIVRGQIR